MDTPHQESFDLLKHVLLTAPLLLHPDFTQPFKLQTDASIDDIGPDNQERPVAYASRTLHAAEKNYGITELETLAVVEFVKHFRLYLYQQDVIVETDHIAVKTVLSKANPSTYITSWGLALADIKLDIHPGKLKLNSNADALSCLSLPHASPTFNIDTDLIQRPEIHMQVDPETYPNLIDDFNILEITKNLQVDPLNFHQILIPNS